MLDTRSSYRKIKDEQRRHPRLELHCRAVVQGLNGIFTVTDISLGGVFIEPQGPTIVKIGQVANLKIKLPEKENSIQVKVRFVSQNKMGIVCEFLRLSPENKDIIKQCIEMFSNTLPVRNDEMLKVEHRHVKFYPT